MGIWFDAITGQIMLLPPSSGGGGGAVSSVNGQSGVVQINADDVPYDNSTSGLTATDVQAAVDELQTEIDSLPNPIVYKGTYNATTNIPALSNSDTGKTGFLYQVNVAGTQDFGAGAITFDVGDKVVNNGATWDKWDMTDAVTSVNGQTGTVILNATNVNAANQTLSNLTSPTAINEDLISSANNTIAIGTSSNQFSSLYVSKIKDSLDNSVIDIQNKILRNSSDQISFDFENGSIYDTNEILSAEFNNRTLYSNLGFPSLQWSGSEINVNDLPITNVADPVSDQDAATKAYVDAATGSPSGNPGAFAEFDSVTGLLTSSPIVSFDNADPNHLLPMIFNATAAVPAVGTVDSLRIDTQYDGQDIDYANGPTVNSAVGINGNVTTIDNFSSFLGQSNIGADSVIGNINTFLDTTAINVGATVDNYNGIYLGPSINTENINNYNGITVTAGIGLGDITAVNSANDINIYTTVGENSTINQVRNLYISPGFQTGASVNTYTGIGLFPQVNSDITSIRGFQAGPQLGQNDPISINDLIDIQLTTRLYDGASLGSYSGLNITPQFDQGSTIVNSIQSMYINASVDSSVNGINSININNNIGPNSATSINNVNDINVNTNFNSFSTVDNYQGIIVSPSVQSGAVLNNYRGMSIGINSPISVNQASGINIDMTNFTVPGGFQGTAINSQGLHSLNANYETSAAGSPGFVQLNYLGGNITIASGFPLSNTFGFMNNFSGSIQAHDDVGPDPSGFNLGIATVGFVGQLAVDSGKTVDTVNYAAGGASIPPQSTGGVVSNINIFSALGIIDGGAGPGGIIVTNQKAFKLGPNASAYATNSWGLSIEDTAAENYLAKSLAIGTATSKVSSSGVGLEVLNKSILIDGSSLQLKNTNTVSLSVPSLTNDYTFNLPDGMGIAGQILSTNGIDSATWVDSSGSAGDIPETTVSLIDQQGSPTTVPGFIFSPFTVRSFQSLVSVYVDATTPLFQSFILHGVQVSGDWQLSYTSIGDDADIVLSISSSGQVQYISGSYPGFNDITAKYRAIVTGI